MTDDPQERRNMALEAFGAAARLALVLGVEPRRLTGTLDHALRNAERVPPTQVELDDFAQTPMGRRLANTARELLNVDRRLP